MIKETNAQRILSVVAVVSIYWFVSISLVFINKRLLNSEELKLDAPIFVTWFQCVITVGLCIVLRILTVFFPDYVSFPDFHYDVTVAAKVMPLTIIFVSMISFNNLCLQHVGVAFYYVGRSLTTVFNVICTYLILKQTTSLNVILCCAVIVGGFFFGVDEEGKGGSLSVLGISFGVLASLAVAMNAIFTKKVLPMVDNSVTKLLFYNNLNAIVLFIPLILLNSEVHSIINYKYLSSSSFWFMMVVSGVFGFGMGYVTGWQIQVIGPLSHSISGTAKACFQTVLATMYFQQIKSFNWWLSNFIVLGGSFAYTMIKYRENQKKDAEPKPDILPTSASDSKLPEKR